MIVNLTPHNVSVADKEGNIIQKFEPSGILARVEVSSKVVSVFNGIEIRKTVFGDISGIPEQKDGVLYLVSTLVAQVANRQDVISPDTGSTAVRKDGQIVAVRGFQTFFD